MKVLVLGVTGMLGSTVCYTLSCHKGFEVWGTLRNKENLKYFPSFIHPRLISDVDVLDFDMLVKVFETVRPDIVINCIGLIKQHTSVEDPLTALPVNSMLPYRIAKLCALTQTRLIHISTDCVFSGNKGFYTEEDVADAEDLYGKSKLIGEIKDLPHVITLRTSLIGHELNSNFALLDWFLSQKDSVKGYTKAVFSGLPTNELVKVISDFVIPRPDLYGLYHVAVNPIDKYELLNLVAEIYKKKISIIPDESLKIDRSLNATRFNIATGYTPPKWPELITNLFEYKKQYGVNWDAS